MSSFSFDTRFINSLKKCPEDRSLEELNTLYMTLQEMEALSTLREPSLRSLCKTLRYIRCEKDEILYFRGERAYCWYILLSGYVFIDGSMYCPGASFGKRPGLRVNDCVILEIAEMLVIDYPDTGGRSVTPATPCSTSLGCACAHHISCMSGTQMYTSDTEMGNRGSRAHCCPLPLIPPSSSSLSSDRHAHTLSCAAVTHTSALKQKQQQQRYEGVGRSARLRHHTPETRGVARCHADSVDGGHGVRGADYTAADHDVGVQTQLSVIEDQVHSIVCNMNSLSIYKGSTDSHCSSDTSSAYSGSDTIHSFQSYDPSDDVDLSGLIETTVDSDEDDELLAQLESLPSRDPVRECMETDPSSRTEEDIDILLEFTQHLRAFSNMTLSVRRALCSVMVFAVVHKAGTVVMQDQEELDAWSVIVNGQVEIIDPQGGPHVVLGLGDSFGITPTMDKLFQRGTMRTCCDDCQFVCITQSAYYRILSQGEENTKRFEQDGQVVLITEHRTLASGTTRGYLVIQGTPERLIEHLIEDNCLVDPFYVEDFLLTRRIFLPNPFLITECLMAWFQNEELRNRVTRVVLQWVNSHFVDFDTNSLMMNFLHKFSVCLETNKMLGQLGLLNFECAAKARVRLLTLARSNREQPLSFTIVGGLERSAGIYIASVEAGSKAEEIGLKKGDQLIEMNKNSFEKISLSRAMELMKDATHLSFSVKNNLLGYNEMLQNPIDDLFRYNKMKKLPCLESSPKNRLAPDSWINNSSASRHDMHPKSLSAIGQRTLKLRKAFMKAIIPRTTLHSHMSDDHLDHHCSPSATSSLSSTSSCSVCRHSGATLRPPAPGASLSSHSFTPGAGHTLPPPSHTLPPPSHAAGTQQPAAASGLSPLADTSHVAAIMSGHCHNSSPDLRCLHVRAEQSLSGGVSDSTHGSQPEGVLKVYRADHSHKYLLVHKDTTAREVCSMTLREFGLSPDSCDNYNLYEVTVGTNNVVKQRRLPDNLNNLADRIELASRYYLRNNLSTDTLVSDELAVDIAREKAVNLLELDPAEVAAQLTLDDFAIFRQIEPTEYIVDLFQLECSYGSPYLQQYVQLSNREMFWVVTAILSEQTIARRTRIIKQFIKIARHCKECKNFNTMFNILSGLNNGSVGRLKTTWEKISSKHMKLYKDMLELMDPSRNMCRYRSMLNSENIHPPMIPFCPIIKKDLTFIHLGNDTYVNGLVNFEKLRMLSKEIRSLLDMCSVPYEHSAMTDFVSSSCHNNLAGVPALNHHGNGSVSAHRNSTVKRRRKSNAHVINPKKMYETAQMVRKVRSYLKSLHVIQDEDRLIHMSVECEPSAVSLSSIKRKQATPSSPSPSAASTASGSSLSLGSSHRSSITEHTGGVTSGYPQHSKHVTTRHPSTSGVEAGLARAKFGTASPSSVRKLMSLAETGRVRSSGSCANVSAAHGCMQHTPVSAKVSGAATAVSASAGGGGATVTADIHASRLLHFCAADSLVKSHYRRSVSSGRVSDKSHSDTYPVDLCAESSSVSGVNMSRKSVITPLNHGSETFQMSSADSVESVRDCRANTAVVKSIAATSSSSNGPSAASASQCQPAAVSSTVPAARASVWHNMQPGERTCTPLTSHVSGRRQPDIMYMSKATPACMLNMASTSKIRTCSETTNLLRKSHHHISPPCKKSNNIDLEDKVSAV